MEILENEKNITIIRNKSEENAVCYLFSYNCEIAIYNEISKRLAISQDFWDYSQTTLKHLKHFINTYTAYTYEDKKQFQKLIEDKQKSDFLPIVLF